MGFFLAGSGTIWGFKSGANKKQVGRCTVTGWKLGLLMEQVVWGLQIQCCFAPFFFGGLYL